MHDPDSRDNGVTRYAYEGEEDHGEQFQVSSHL
jgi:hypothetical protein